jgi:dienelactone hydrolase
MTSAPPRTGRRTATTAALLVAATLILGGCGTPSPSPVVTLPSATTAPTALPAGWSTSPMRLPDGVSGDYVAPTTPGRLNAALILTDSAATTATANRLAVVLAGQGVASLRLPTTPRGFGTSQDFNTAQATARAALKDLAAQPGVRGDDLLVVGHGDAAALTMSLAAGSDPAVHGFALLEPVFGAAGTPSPATLVSAIPIGKHVLISCSSSDSSVSCSDLQHLSDALAGTHVNYVRLDGVDHGLADTGSPGGPFSAELNRSLGSWADMQ